MTAQDTAQLMSGGSSNQSTNNIPSSKTSSTNILPSSKNSSTNNLPSSKNSSTHFLPTMSSQTNAKAKAAARKHLEKAESKLRRKPLRWKPRLESAGEEYCLAARHLLRGGLIQDGVDSLLKGAECFQANRSWLRAAKVRQNALQIQLIKPRMAKVEDVVNNAKKTSFVYIKASHPDAAAAILQKTAGAIFEQDRPQSISLYKQAIDLLEIEQRPTLAAMYSIQMMKLLINTPGGEEEAMKAVIKTIHLYQLAANFVKAGSCLVILSLLMLRDKKEMDGSDIFNEYSSNLNEDNRELIEKLQKAAHQPDPELLKEIKGNKIFKNFNQEIQDLANEVLGKHLNDSEITDCQPDNKNLSEPSFPLSETEEKTPEEAGLDVSILSDPRSIVPLAAAAAATAGLASTSKKSKPYLKKQEALLHQPTLPTGSFLPTIMPAPTSPRRQPTLPTGSFLPTSMPAPRLVADAVGFSLLGAASYGMSTDQFREFRKDNNIWMQPSIDCEE